MRAISTTLGASAAVLGLAASAWAQDHSAHGGAMAAMELPQACMAAEAPAMAGMENMESAMAAMSVHQKAMMEGMMKTEGPMMQGMMAGDPDVAFACAMIPHHQGAIEMAEVELEYGDSDEMKALAEKIIADQKREIEQLTRWIEDQAR